MIRTSQPGAGRLRGPLRVRRNGPAKPLGSGRAGCRGPRLLRGCARVVVAQGQPAAHAQRDEQHQGRGAQGEAALADGGGLVAGRAGAGRARGAGALAVPRGPPESSSGAGTRMLVWVSRLASADEPGTSGTAPRRRGSSGAGAYCCSSYAWGSGSVSGSSTSSGGMPARCGSCSRSRAASSEARSREAGALARHWTRSCQSSSGMPGSGTTVSVTCRRSTAPGCPPPKGVKPASSSYRTVARA